MKEMHDAPVITISIHLPPPSGKKGRKKGEEAAARKGLAKQKLKEGPKDPEKKER
jgi:hypothetical protein